MDIRTVTDFPRRVRTIPTEWITLADGTRLAATIWLPEDAEQNPVPAILEFLPYRRRDGTVLRDRQMHAYFAGHGYAGVRVDMRGSGDPDGILARRISAAGAGRRRRGDRLAGAQPWCSGAVGMMGISWGGFNPLQVASHRPPALKAIITACSTDDRYADDCHFHGRLPAQQFDRLGLDHVRLRRTAAGSGGGRRPLARHVAGAHRRSPNRWSRHGSSTSYRDDYWKQGSVNEDYSSITAAVYAVGGWADGYSNAIPRMLAGLKAPRKGLIGPWAHAYPQAAYPGPQIGFLQEAVRWWDYWLKGIDNGIMDEPMLRVWMQESVRPATTYETRPGRWVAENHGRRQAPVRRSCTFTPSGLRTTPAEGNGDHRLPAFDRRHLRRMVPLWAGRRAAGRPAAGRRALGDLRHGTAGRTRRNPRRACRHPGVTRPTSHPP